MSFESIEWIGDCPLREIALDYAFVLVVDQLSRMGEASDREFSLDGIDNPVVQLENFCGASFSNPTISRIYPDIAVSAESIGVLYE